jgi:hypothetical protein
MARAASAFGLDGRPRAGGAAEPPPPRSHSATLPGFYQHSLTPMRPRPTFLLVQLPPDSSDSASRMNARLV